MMKCTRIVLWLLLFQCAPVWCFGAFYNFSRSLANLFLNARLLESEDMSCVSLIKRRGLPVEVHNVTTEDGYVLEVHRIPGSGSSNSSMYPVIVQHGNFQSSSDWALENDSLAFFLSSAGYDVFLGNQRGNSISMNHMKYEAHQSGYWNFTFDEMGYYDLPAMVDYVRNITGKNKTHYISFSLGSTAFFAGMSKRPELSDKIGIGIAMGPSTFQQNFWHGWVQIFAPFVWAMQLATNYLGEMPVLSTYVANALHKVLPLICHPKVDLFGICINFVILTLGQTKDITKERLYTVTKVSPSSSSMKTFFHEMQLMGSGRFCEYDYGPDRNRIAYGREDPPDYNLTNVRAPVSLIVGPNDFLAHKEDAKTLHKKLPNVVDLHYVPDDSWTHLDFCYGEHVGSLVYEHIVNLLRNHDDSS